MKIASYQELIVWQKSMDLVELTYQFTNKLPINEKYALTSQMQRAAISVPSNIAEGNVRNHRKEYAHFISIALGSSAELETQFLICSRVHNCDDIELNNILALINEIKKMLYTLLNKLNKTN